MSIKIELPEDNASVLHHFGFALKQVAKDLGYVSSVTIACGEVTVGEPGDIEAAVALEPVQQTEVFYKPEDYVMMYHEGQDVWALAQSEKKVSEFENKGYVVKTVAEYEAWQPNPAAAEEEDSGEVFNQDISTDTEGFQWDERIHSSSRKINADGTWKAIRKPTAYEAEQWAQYVETVKAELKGASGSVATIPDVPVESVPLEPLPVPPPAAVIPPPPAVEHDVEIAAEQQVVVPPVVNDAPPATFQQLMQLITTNRDKITIPDVTEILKAYGVAALPLLSTQRADVVPQVYDDVKAFVEAK